MPGHTHEPFECCGAEAGPYGRPKGKICNECAKLIADGKAARDRIEAERANGLQVYRWTSADYGWPCFHATEPSLGETERELSRAFFHLVNAITQPAPASTEPKSPHFEIHHYRNGEPYEHYLPWLTALDIKTTRSDAWTWTKLIVMRPELRGLLTTLHERITQAINEAFIEGKRQGSSLLHGLSTGEVSLDDFDEALLPAQERAERRKANRGY